MLKPDDVIPSLLRACPSFRPAWNEHLAEWGAAERGLYIDTLPFVGHVVERFEAGDTRSVSAAFAAVEELLREGDAETRTIAALGILETLQNVAGHRSCTAGAFETFLGPLAREEWLALNAAWSELGASA